MEMLSKNHAGSVEGRFDQTTEVDPSPWSWLKLNHRFIPASPQLNPGELIGAVAPETPASAKADHEVHRALMLVIRRWKARQGSPPVPAPRDFVGDPRGEHEQVQRLMPKRK